MRDLWELVCLCRWVWETPSQGILTRGDFQNHLESLCDLHTLGSCCWPTDTDGRGGGGTCPFGRSFLGDSVVSYWLSHRVSPLPVRDPSRGCGHLAWLGCHTLCDWNPGRVITDLRLRRAASSIHSCKLATRRYLLTILTTEHLHLCAVTVPPCGALTHIVSWNHLDQFHHQRSVLPAPWKKMSFQLDLGDVIWEEWFSGFLHGFLSPQFLGLWYGASDTRLTGLGCCLCSIQPVSLPEYPCLHLQDEDKTTYLTGLWGLHVAQQEKHIAFCSLHRRCSIHSRYLPCCFVLWVFVDGRYVFHTAGVLEGAARCHVLLLVVEQTRVIMTVGGAPLYWVPGTVLGTGDTMGRTRWTQFLTSWSLTRRKP